MAFIDAPSNFYIGRTYDPATDEIKKDEAVYYDSRDLTTHGVVLGMTGSGKTGLCISLLEEAILDGIPAIIVDPKGDIGNLLLTFPDLQPTSFEPWINEDEARRDSMDIPALAAKKAGIWQKGLADWEITPERMNTLKQMAEFTIYTPGSDSGVPISILASLRVPKAGVEGNEEVVREQITGLVSAILSLAGITAEPMQDPRHVLLSNIFEHSWRAGKDLTLEDLIMQVQKPPFEKLGILSVNDFMPEKERASLMMALNNVIASPSFGAWLKGVPMDIQSLLYTPEGKPRVAIFYIAHLNDKERMFVMTLVLETMLSWIRNQAGTSSLRAILYIDEIFGFFPPIANPPSKEPLMRLLKQARAFGVGCLLATQNPVDLDYKGLSNIGTWFIGRLQSAGDAERIIAGLKEAASAGDMEMQEVKQMIAQLKSRVFMMRNIHEYKPVLFSSRFAMNYLAGPFTRQQISKLMSEKRGLQAPTAQSTASAAPTSGAVASAPSGYSSTAQLVKGVDQFYLPVNISSKDALAQWESAEQVTADADSAQLAFEPFLLAQAEVRYDEAKADLRIDKTYAFRVPDLDRSGFVRWIEYEATTLDKHDLGNEARGSALFSAIPAALTDPKRIKELEADFVDTLYKDFALKVPYNREFKVYGNPDDAAGEFEARVRQAAREIRDQEVDEITERYERKMATLEEKIAKKQTELQQDQARAQSSNNQNIADIAMGVLGMLGGGGRRRTSSSLSRIGRAATKAIGTDATEAEAAETQVELEQLQQQYAQLQQEFDSQLPQIDEQFEDRIKAMDEIEISPAKKDISVVLFGIGWQPRWVFTANGKTESVAASE
jgi:Helicase HerA, central domain